MAEEIVLHFASYSAQIAAKNGELKRNKKKYVTDSLKM